MRYLPLTDADRQEMLATIGVKSSDDLFSDVPAKAIISESEITLPSHKSEMQVERELSAMAGKNTAAGSVPCFLGAGTYRHHIPTAVDHLIQRSEFLTAYTPYQPEVSQGTLQALFEFQTQVAMITGMDAANASMYDGATACAEAVSMACRATRRKKAILSGKLHPHYSEVTKDFTKQINIKCESLAPDVNDTEDLIGRIDKETACVVVQTPSFFGHLKDYSALAEACHAVKALLVIVITETLSLGLLKSPAEMDADIVVCEGQSLAGGLNFGGPAVGFLSVKKKYIRQMPGRFVGQTKDVDGKRGFVLTLSTREQHIRRGKATSNICSNSGLMALAYSMHMSLLGETGFTRLAEINHETAVTLSEKLAKVDGVKVLSSTFFNEFAVILPDDAGKIVEALAKRKIFGGVPVSRLYPKYPELRNVMLVAATETNTEQDMDSFVSELSNIIKEGV
ncbi:MAG: aminomethyl-transferring glycine dehydrogenase subunit GcvPA [Alphaproteobacteria bacterium]|nr:aminomethyl-transferring glycine dehydrogenase subunit GcvPA [Alphaproteobacteria bacterium]